MERALAATLDDDLSVDDLVTLTLETGKWWILWHYWMRPIPRPTEAQRSPW